MAAETDLERKKDLVARFLDLMGTADLDDAFELLTPDATWFTLSSRTHTGRQEMRAKIDFVYANILQSPIRQNITVMTAEGDRVAVMSQGHAVTVAGDAYDNLYHFLFEMRDDRIARIWEYNDTALVASVLMGKGPMQLPTG